MLASPVRYSAYDGQLVLMRYQGQGSFSKPERIGPPEPMEVHALSVLVARRKVDRLRLLQGGQRESKKNPEARLRLVRRDGGSVIDLGNALGGWADVGSTFPKFAPTGQSDCQLLFVTFHSRLDYGVLRRNRDAAEGGFEQLWMTALDLSLLPADPSSPPLWLPFQDIHQKNVMATWSDVVPCLSEASCGPGATCRSGRCLATSD